MIWAKKANSIRNATNKTYGRIEELNFLSPVKRISTTILQRHCETNNRHLEYAAAQKPNCWTRMYNEIMSEKEIGILKFKK